MIKLIKNKYNLCIFLYLLIFMQTSLFAGEQPEINIYDKVLSVNECINIGLSKNPEIIAAQEKLNQAEWKLSEQRSFRYPKLNLRASYDRLDYLTGGKSYYIGDSYDDYQSYMELKQTLYSGGRIKNQIKINEIDKKLQTENFKNIQNEIIYKIKERYYNLIYRRMLLNVKEKALEHMENYKVLAEALYKAGKVSELDVLQAEVRYDDINQELIKDKTEVSLAKMSLNEVLGLNLEADISINDTLNFTKKDVSLEECLAAAVRNNSDLRIIQLLLEQSDARIKSSVSGYLPDISAKAHYGYEWGNEGLYEDKDRYGVNLSLNMPLWDTGYTSSKIKHAKSQRAQLNARKNFLESRITLKIKAAYLNLQDAEERIATTQKTVNKAEKSLKTAYLLYKRGAGTALNVLDTQVALLQAQTNNIQAIVDYELAKAELDDLTGSDIYKDKGD